MRLKRTLMIVLGASLAFIAQNAHAVPSFARQTGLACMSCHTIFPKLTSFGRQFKLNGYTLTGLQQVQDQGSAASPPLKINAFAPLSVMLQTALTHTNKVAANTENNHIAFPSALSIYYAGEISPHMGAFLQFTMDGPSSNFRFDMADLRYANKITTAGGMPIAYGVTVDNMTGMEDLWNTTPSWTYPYLAASPSHGDSPAVNSLMGAGLGAYAMFDDHLYAYVSAYSPMGDQKTMTMGGMQMGKPHAFSPYWRLALQGNIGSSSYLEVGTYGTVVQVYGNGMTTAMATRNSDKFTDVALDAQYELTLGNNQLNAHAVWIHENQDLAAAYAAGSVTSSSQHMDQIRADVAFIFGDRYQCQAGYFDTTGSSGAYTFGGMGDAAFGGNSSGYVAELDVLPWENTKLSLQYTGYNKLNGASGSAASDGNALVANAWFMW